MNKSDKGLDEILEIIALTWEHREHEIDCAEAQQFTEAKQRLQNLIDSEILKATQTYRREWMPKSEVEERERAVRIDEACKFIDITLMATSDTSAQIRMWQEKRLAQLSDDGQDKR